VGGLQSPPSAMGDSLNRFPPFPLATATADHGLGLRRLLRHAHDVPRVQHHGACVDTSRRLDYFSEEARQTREARDAAAARPAPHPRYSSHATPSSVLLPPPSSAVAPKFKKNFGFMFSFLGRTFFIIFSGTMALAMSNWLGYVLGGLTFRALTELGQWDLALGGPLRCAPSPAAPN
jgi:hypothetical protein